MIKVIEYFSNQVYFLKFLIHVYKNFRVKKTKDPKNITLVEFNTHKPAIIGILYLIKNLQKNQNSKVVFFYPGIAFDYKRFVKRLINLIAFNFKQTLTFLFIGGSIKILTNFKPRDDKNVEKIFKETVSNFKDKKDLSVLKLENILVGDLFYDTYTRWNAKPTVDFKSEEFKNELYKYFKEFYKWLEIFEKDKISSLVVTHPVYNLALPLRIAQKFDIPAYIGSINFLQYFDKDRKHLWDNKYRNSFSTLNNDEKNKALKFSKKKLEIKFINIFLIKIKIY